MQSKVVSKENQKTNKNLDIIDVDQEFINKLYSLFEPLLKDEESTVNEFYNYKQEYISLRKEVNKKQDLKEKVNINYIKEQYISKICNNIDTLVKYGNMSNKLRNKTKSILYVIRKSSLNDVKKYYNFYENLVKEQ